MTQANQILAAVLIAIVLTLGIHYGGPPAYRYVCGATGIQTGKLHVLFVYDQTKIASLPSEQERILLDGGVRNYLKDHGDGAFLPLGSTELPKEWEAMYADAIKDGRQPVVVIDSEGGKRLDLEPWPKTAADTINLLKKYGGQ